MIKVLSGGLLTSIQDLGRFGYRSSGVPLSGVMDAVSARLANKLMENTPSEALMEITNSGPVLHFLEGAEIAITGAAFKPTINDIGVSMNSRIRVPKDGILKFGLPDYGLRAYLAMKGGFSTEEILGSRSQYQSITKKKRVEKGDSFLLEPFELINGLATASVKVDLKHFSSEMIEVYPGPEFDFLPKSFQKEIVKKPLQILAESNRMAYLLKGFEEFSANEIITGPVQPGTVQLTPSGQCIVLMRDAQTTGGYARILQLSESAISQLSQKRTFEKVYFKLI
ncbi:5-oxoprolinase subunit C family protein [Ulvibacter antarcticus]|uniref:Biotin-dependent carboxylase-like uncharacterized protein n=1 Tax=Ulvibacter antarcticus TaxID=442714 RepID=A0A3L9YLH2_9FLAO|nr:biotin-dependent carboxyltransferase family protein [Ulvibacter antarcticus]RMA58858.1 biotin-dependent carboxylase-like uncharacterized protein [Ulvibacter antarcticus]